MISSSDNDCDPDIDGAWPRGFVSRNARLDGSAFQGRAAEGYGSMLEWTLVRAMKTRGRNNGYAA